ncbi:MAG: NUDIX domain-containing protein [Oscillospiraceae bacterium]|nr:NUDIX domain-containing protein [Oscillospiraceae bacterium]
MHTLFEIDMKDYDPSAPVFVRPSVRGIIIRDGKVGLVHSLKYNYYKFPGGGMESGEEQTETLIREVREESGLIVVPDSIREYGMVHRVQKGQYGDTFVQDNYYYFCDTQGEPMSQRLDDYEAEAEFTLEFVDPAEAIRVNRDLPRSYWDSVMLGREARVLEMLVKEGHFG